MSRTATIDHVHLEGRTEAGALHVRWGFGLRLSDAADTVWHSEWTPEGVAPVDSPATIDLSEALSVAHYDIVYDLRQNGYTVTTDIGALTFRLAGRDDAAAAALERVAGLSVEAL
jgi:hypothetical protein